MKRTLAFILAVTMVLLLCSCQNENNSSSNSDDIIVEEIIIDQTGNTIVSSEESTASQEDTGSQIVSSTNNTSSETKVEIDYNTVVEVDICNEIVRAYLDAKTPLAQYTYLSEFDNVVVDYQDLKLRWKTDGSQSYTLHIAKP